MIIRCQSGGCASLSFKKTIRGMKGSMPALAALFILANAHAAHAVCVETSDGHCRALDGRVTQETIGATICRAGGSYMKDVRDGSWEIRTKRELMQRARISRLWSAYYKLDHVVPIALGGAPTDESNVELQPWPEARRKDKLESHLHRLVCCGKVELRDARRDIAEDWRKAQETYAKLRCSRS
jgi:hypothetical protein